MKPGLRIAIASAALAALALPALAGGQGGSPTLTEAQDSEFPDRVYLYRTPQQTNLRRLEVTENGGPVPGLSVDSGSKSSGAVLLIDASNSMAGEPIEAAMAAARAFMAQRKDELPVAVIAYNDEVTVLTDFTRDSKELTAAVAEAPTTAEGTRIYDALIEAARLAEAQGYARTTAVLLSDGHRRGVQATLDETLTALNDANVRVISVGLQSPQYDPETLQSVSKSTGGTYVESATPEQLEPIFTTIGQQLSNEYVVSYRSLLPPDVKATVVAVSPGFAPATATYTTPPLDLAPQGTFERSWIDETITSPWLMIFVVVAVLALVAFAIFSAIDVRNRSLRRRMAAYVTVPSEEESRMRRAEVAAILADTAQRTVGNQRWWQRFETDVELGGFSLSALAIAGWTIVAGIIASLRCSRDLPVAVVALPRAGGAVRDALDRRAAGQEDATSVRGAAGRQPRRARRRDAHGPLDHGSSLRHGRQLHRAVEDRVPACPPGRAARCAARRCAHGDGTTDAQLRRGADRAGHAATA